MGIEHVGQLQEQQTDLGVLSFLQRTGGVVRRVLGRARVIADAGRVWETRRAPKGLKTPKDLDTPKESKESPTS